MKSDISKKMILFAISCFLCLFFSSNVFAADRITSDKSAINSDMLESISRNLMSENPLLREACCSTQMPYQYQVIIHVFEINRYCAGLIIEDNTECLSCGALLRRDIREVYNGCGQVHY